MSKSSDSGVDALAVTLFEGVAPVPLYYPAIVSMKGDSDRTVKVAGACSCAAPGACSCAS